MSNYQYIFNPLADAEFSLVPTADYISSLISLTSGDVISALGYTPYDASNPAGYLTVGSLSSSDITTALGYTPAMQAVSPVAGDIAIVDSDGNVIDSGKVFSIDGTLSSDSDNIIPTQKAIKTYADNLLSVASALEYKGVFDLSTNPDYPAGNVGDVYSISVSGLIGGPLGYAMTMGDLLICNTDNSGGTEAEVGSDWDKIQLALNGVVLGPSVSNSGDIVTFNGSSGTVIQDSGVSISTDGTMSANSDSLIPTQKSIRTYITSGLSTKQNTITTGTNLQYLAGDLSLITFPTNVSTFSNDVGYLTNSTGVSSFNTRHGAVTLTSSDVTTALTYTPSKQAPTPTSGDIATVDGSGNVTDSGIASTAVVTLTGSQTLTSKRITRRVNTITSSATPSINTDTTGLFTITALSTAITSMTSGLSGTPNNGDLLEIRILDNGTAQSITWGSSFTSTSTTLPLTTIAGITIRIILEWNSSTSLWECIGTT